MAFQRNPLHKGKILIFSLAEVKKKDYQQSNIHERAQVGDELKHRKNYKETSKKWYHHAEKIFILQTTHRPIFYVAKQSDKKKSKMRVNFLYI
jgi:hypothetical protein